MSKMFPIMLPGYSSQMRERAEELRAQGQGTLVVGVPWELIAPHEKQALRNHSQTLQRLAERGGLSACEAVAVLADRDWRGMPWTEANAVLVTALDREAGR